MDQNSQVFDEVLKKDVKKNLVDAIILSLQTKRMSFREMRESANYILDNIDSPKNYSDLILFLNELKTEWPQYSNVSALYKNKFYKEKEKVLINRLSSYINSIKPTN